MAASPDVLVAAVMRRRVVPNWRSTTAAPRAGLARAVMGCASLSETRPWHRSTAGCAPAREPRAGRKRTAAARTAAAGDGRGSDHLDFGTGRDHRDFGRERVSGDSDHDSISFI